MRFIYSKLKSETKPQRDEVKAYQFASNYEFKEGLSILEIANLICEGRAWRAGDYNPDIDSFKKSNVLGSYIIALDFDKTDSTPQEVIDYSISLGIIPNFTYYSYSQGHKNGNNFRVVYVFDELIDKRKYEQMYAVMLDLFSDLGADKATKDCSRLWFGSTMAPTIVNTEYSTLSTLGWVSILNKYEKVKKTRQLLSGKKGFIPDYVELPMPDAVVVEKHWADRLRVRCSLWDKWCKGEYLNYNQRLTLMTNLKFLRRNSNNTESDSSVYSEIMKYFNKETYAEHTCDESQIYSMLRDRTLSPLPIVLMKDGSYETIPSFFSSEEAKVVLNPIKKCTLAELDEWMDVNVPKFLASDGIGYLKSQTASGKTERIIDYLMTLDFYEKKIIYAVPTYNVLDEFRERLLTKIQESDYVLSECDEYDLNIYSMPKAEIGRNDIVRINLGLNKQEIAPDRVNKITSLVNEDTGLFIITHQLLSLVKNVNADLIIVDENVEETLLKENLIPRRAFEDLGSYLGENQQAKNILCDICQELTRSKIEDKYGKNIDITRLDVVKNELIKHLDEYIADCREEKVVPAQGIFDTEGIYNAKITFLASGEPAVRFIRKSDMIYNAIEHNTPVKLFTATPKTALLKKYFTEDISVLEAPIAENKGKIYQYTKLSGSKGRYGEKVEDLTQYVKECLQDKIDLKKAVFLSFKGFAEYFEKEGFTVPKNIDGDVVHLQNNAGMDCFKGKNVIVAGKFDYPANYYFNVYSDLHPELNSLELPALQNKVITFGGNIEQRVYTYCDPELSDIQLQNLELTLCQSAGRARALRAAGANVYIFSDFIIPDVDEIIKK